MHRCSECALWGSDYALIKLVPLRRLFSYEIRAANSLNDRLVPFSTSALLPRNPLIERPTRVGEAVSESAAAASESGATLVREAASSSGSSASWWWPPAAWTWPEFLGSGGPRLLPSVRSDALPGFPHVLSTRLPENADELAAAFPQETWYASCQPPARRRQLVAMLRGLGSLPWQRTALNLPAHVLSSAHTHALASLPIINRHGLDVVEHLSSTIAQAATSDDLSLRPTGRPPDA